MSRDPQAVTDEILRRRAVRGCRDFTSETPLAEVLDSLGLIVTLLDLETALGGPVLDVATAGTLKTVGDLHAAVSRGAAR